MTCRSRRVYGGVQAQGVSLHAGYDQRVQWFVPLPLWLPVPLVLWLPRPVPSGTGRGFLLVCWAGYTACSFCHVCTASLMARVRAVRSCSCCPAVSGSVSQVPGMQYCPVDFRSPSAMPPST